ncbi:ATP-grasp domain-containing protein [Streptomyces sp. NPDC059446]|uniref:ATP-grasp domain-containing protein n=1 Tax=Streptomyces sp. NPDC059446 TaxID=3346833 RepID=UPI0036C82E69
MPLVLPPRLTASARSLRDTARRRGLETVQLTAPEVPGELCGGDAYLHAGPSFADAVAPALGVVPLEAPPDWLARLPDAFLGRGVRAVPLREAYGLRRPVFVKSPNDKSIPALVYSDGSRLPGPDAVDPGTVVLLSEIVVFEAEYRLYVLDGRVHTGSRYAASGQLRPAPLSAGARAFGTELLDAVAHTLPSAIVVDVGFTDAGRWAVVEANAAWASGCYASDPDLALDVVLRAAGPAAHLTERDSVFVR